MAQKKVKTIVWSNNAAKQYFEILEFLIKMRLKLYKS